MATSHSARDNEYFRPQTKRLKETGNGTDSWTDRPRQTAIRDCCRPRLKTQCDRTRNETEPENKPTRKAVAFGRTAGQHPITGASKTKSADEMLFLIGALL